MDVTYGYVLCNIRIALFKKDNLFLCFIKCSKISSRILNGNESIL